MASKNDARFKALYDGMLAAGAAAAAAAKVTPVPMTVSQHANPLNDASPVTKSWFVPGGVCGFGWVSLKGNTAFGKWLRKNGLARPGYPSGLSISSKLMTQSLERNAAWAHGAAKFLNDNGIADAYGQSRID